MLCSVAETAHAPRRAVRTMQGARLLLLFLLSISLSAATWPRPGGNNQNLLVVDVPGSPARPVIDWTFEQENATIVSMVFGGVDGELLFLLTSPTLELLAISARSGETIWNVTASPSTSLLVSSGEVIYLLGGEATALHSNGTRLWQNPAPVLTLDALVLDDILYLIDSAADQLLLVALDQHGGQLWALPILMDTFGGRFGGMCASMDGTRLYISLQSQPLGAATLYAYDLTTIDPNTPQLMPNWTSALWESPFPMAPYHAPVPSLLNHSIVATCHVAGSAGVCSINITTGERIWGMALDIPRGVDAESVVSIDTDLRRVYVVHASSLLSIDLDKGEVINTAVIESAKAPVVTAGHVLLLVDPEEGIVEAKDGKNISRTSWALEADSYSALVLLANPPLYNVSRYPSTSSASSVSSPVSSSPTSLLSSLPTDGAAALQPLLYVNHGASLSAYASRNLPDPPPGNLLWLGLVCGAGVCAMLFLGLSLVFVKHKMADRGRAVGGDDAPPGPNAASERRRLGRGQAYDALVNR